MLEFILNVFYLELGLQRATLYKFFAQDISLWLSKILEFVFPNQDSYVIATVKKRQN